MRNRCSDSMEGLAEDFTVFKGNNKEENLLAIQIAHFKSKYRLYFGKGESKWKPVTPRERWECRWEEINQYISGEIFSTVFRIKRDQTALKTPQETLSHLRDLAYENYSEAVETDRYKDLLLLITTSMALHSPFGNKSNKKSTTQLGKEYRDIYKLVEQLFALEERDERFRRLYAHLFKVMFLWPRPDIELDRYRAQEFYDALRKLYTRWESKRKVHVDPEKTLSKKCTGTCRLRKRLDSIRHYSTWEKVTD